MDLFRDEEGCNNLHVNVILTLLFMSFKLVYLYEKSVTVTHVYETDKNINSIITTVKKDILYSLKGDFRCFGSKNRLYFQSLYCLEHAPKKNINKK